MKRFNSEFIYLREISHVLHALSFNCHHFVAVSLLDFSLSRPPSSILPLATARSDRVDTLPALLQHVDATRRALDDPAQFREMHKWVFHFVKGGEQKRSIEKEMAVELLRLLLDAAKYPLVPPFLEFLTAQKVKIRVAVSHRRSLSVAFSHRHARLLAPSRPCASCEFFHFRIFQNRTRVWRATCGK